MDDNLQLMLETLEEMKEYLPKLKSAVMTMVKDFQGGNQHEAVRLFVPFVEGLEWVMQVAEATKPAQAGLNVKLDETGLKEVLPQMLEGWENEDYILISDILEYEILPILQNWEEVLQGCVGSN